MEWKIRLIGLTGGIMLISAAIFIAIITINCQQNIQELQNQLASVKYSLNKTNELASYRQTLLENLTEENSLLQNFIEQLQKERKNLLQELKNEKKKEQQLNEKIQEAKKITEEIKKQKGILRASYKEVKEFLEEDYTNENKWEENKYVCLHFAADTVRNALSKGIMAGVVFLNFGNDTNLTGGHSLIGFPTRDKGIVYFEPQDDNRIENLEIGEHYCELANWNCKWNDRIVMIGDYLDYYQLEK